MEGQRDEAGRWRAGGPSGNPNGRPVLPAELKGFKKLTPSYVKAVISKLMRMTPAEMMSYLGSGSPNNLEVAVASIVMATIKTADAAKLNFLLDRSIGKVVEERKVSLEPVVYKTTVRADGALMQEVVSESLDEGGAPRGDAEAADAR